MQSVAITAEFAAPSFSPSWPILAHLGPVWPSLNPSLNLAINHWFRPMPPSQRASTNTKSTLEFIKCRLKAVDSEVRRIGKEEAKGRANTAEEETKEQPQQGDRYFADCSVGSRGRDLCPVVVGPLRNDSRPGRSRGYNPHWSQVYRRKDRRGQQSLSR